MLNFHRECWSPVKKHSKAFVFFAVSKQIPIVYSADRGRAEITSPESATSKKIDSAIYKQYPATALYCNISCQSSSFLS